MLKLTQILRIHCLKIEGKSTRRKKWPRSTFAFNSDFCGMEWPGESHSTVWNAIFQQKSFQVSKQHFVQSLIPHSWQRHCESSTSPKNSDNIHVMTLPRLEPRLLDRECSSALLDHVSQRKNTLHVI